MAIGSFLAGPYTSTYNAQVVGLTKEGWRIRQNTHAQEINGSDVYGESLIELINRGLTAEGEAVGLEYGRPGGRAAFMPWGTFGQVFALATPVGMLGSDNAQALVLTAVANTTANAAPGPVTFTASKSILKPGANLDLMFDSRLREMPISLVFLPTLVGGVPTFATTT